MDQFFYKLIPVFIFTLLPFDYSQIAHIHINNAFTWSHYLTKKYSKSIHGCNKDIKNRYDYFIRRDYSYFIAINLYNNQEILPNMMHNILKLSTQYLIRSHINIYESGSSDKTKKLLKEFHYLLNLNNISHTIETSPLNKNDTETNRIDYLAYMRNYAIKPILKNRYHADFVIFMNDVLYCYNDVLELIHQQLLNDAFLTGGMDLAWMTAWRRLLFYDSWVVQERKFGKHPTPKQVINQEVVNNQNQDDLERQQDDLPVQMMCLWNGMTVINATIFNYIEFRRGLNGNKNETLPGECSASEITTFCMDLIKNGFGKILMVPSVKVTYDIESYNYIKFYDTDYAKKHPHTMAHRPAEDVPIIWEPLSDTFDCWPYYTGDRGRERHSQEEHTEYLPAVLKKPVYFKSYQSE
eukprot:NODE_740_length_4324_cov_0.793609.p2 type:complete len:409 gc:universal NODE_740_length_4324_cov_0.793609:3994-2768(-)